MTKKLLGLLIFALAVSLPSAYATTVSLAPGGTVTPPPTNGSSFSGLTLVVDTGSEAFTTNTGLVSGTADIRVYREAGGTLDFFYLISNNASSSDAIGRVTAVNFAGFSTAVAYLTLPSSGIPPTEADRSSGAGDTIGFNFQSGGNTLVAGATSDWLEIQTNATNFKTGSTQIIDGGIAAVNSYAPSSAVPEPMTMGLIGGGLALLGVARMRRAKKA